jgi:L-threonate 2-dehydrogenase
MAETVGVIGLGIMGGAMAVNLVKAGHSVVGYDVDPKAIAAAKTAGVSIVASAADVAKAASTIITSLPSPKIVAVTAKAIAGSPARNCTVCEVSTLALADKMAFRDVLSAVGHVPLDCPLSGTGAQAIVKDLVVFASGDRAAIARTTPIFMGMARKVVDLGAFGNGSKMKFVANLLVAIHNVASAEAMVLGVKAGLDPQQIVDVVGAGAGTSRVFELRAPMMARRTYRPATMKSRIWRKDMQVIGAFAEALDCPTPLFDATGSVYDAALAQGHDDDDVAAVFAVLEQLAGIKR